MVGSRLMTNECQGYVDHYGKRVASMIQPLYGLPGPGELFVCSYFVGHTPSKNENQLLFLVKI